MKKGLQLICLSMIWLLAGNCFAQVQAQTKTKPSFKVDFSVASRSDKEVQEPGFSHWVVNEGGSQEMTINGIKCIIQSEDSKNLRKNGRMRVKFDKWLVHIPFLCYLTILLNLAEGAEYGGC